LNCGLQVFVFTSVILSGCSVTRDVLQTDDCHIVKDELVESRSSILSAISDEEKKHNIKKGLLKSIAIVESGCRPYAVNVSGKSYSFRSAIQASNFVENMVDVGKTNISIGCFQLHYKAHRNKFSSINEMFEPKKNIAYAARLIRCSYDKYGSWEVAVRRYHTGNSKRGKAYYAKVLRAMRNNRDR
jgi:hypothetical protein